MADITMPQLGETVTEGTITRWTKAVGDQVAEDEVLYEVSTDKVDSEVPSPSSGYLAEILVPEGETVAVGTVLARISDEAPDGAAPADAAPEAEPAAEPEGEEEPEGQDEPEDQAEETPEPEPEPEPEPKPAPKQAPAPAKTGKVQAPPKEPARASAPEPSAGSGGGALLSPVVRKLISEHGLDPASIQGTGVGGRITRNDVLKVIDSGGAAPAGDGEEAAPAPAPAAKAPAEAAPAAKPAAAPAGAPAPAATPAAPAAKAGERDEVIPFSRIRRATAAHMVRSKATSAHTVVAVEVDYSAVEKVRAARKEAFKAEEGVGLTYLPFVARAVVDAIHEFPHVNSSVGDDELIVHRYVDLGIAVDLDFQGLLVPVIRDAHDKRLRAIARQVGQLAQKARSKRLSPDDLVGGTFTLTNAGPFGTFLTIPVINQPQTAILSTDGVKKKPVAVVLPDGSDGIAVHPVGILALTFDHRAFDGAYAAAFAAKIKQILETRDWSVEL